jgi:hypothetical protein
MLAWQGCKFEITETAAATSRALAIRNGSRTERMAQSSITWQLDYDVTCGRMLSRLRISTFFEQKGASFVDLEGAVLNDEKPLVTAAGVWCHFAESDDLTLYPFQSDFN